MAEIPTSWAVPSLPHDPVDEPEIVEVDDAYVTRYRKGQLRVVGRPNVWVNGAVYEPDGRLVRVSQKYGGFGGSPFVAADPGQVRPRRAAQRLSGTWLYGGHWFEHFGHFFVETLTTLWPQDAAVEGVIFHAHSPYNTVAPWQQEMLDLTAYGRLPVHVVRQSPAWVDRLVVPSRSLVINAWAHPQAVSVWDQMVAATGVDTSVERVSERRVFLSRRSFNVRKATTGKKLRTTPRRDAGLDRVFADAGFEVIEPETLSIADQLRLAASADVIAGSAGTALHLSAFARNGTRVLELGDIRSPEEQVPNQLVVDSVRGHQAAFVPYRVTVRDLPAVLGDLGLS